MGKRKAKANKSMALHEEKMNRKGKLGRPVDDIVYQKRFLDMLRPVKLHVIIAESNLELVSFENEDENEFYYTHRQLNDEQDNYVREKIDWIKRYFNNIDEVRFQLLWKGFRQGCQRWRYHEIKTIQDFPEYLFDDECDLSYVLHSILTSKIPELEQKSEFEVDELLFLELICLAIRDMVSFVTLQTIKLHYNEIIRYMSSLKEIVLDHYEKSSQMTKTTKKISKSEQMEINNLLSWNPSIIEDDHRRGEVYKVLNGFDQEKVTQSIVSKKSIGRPSKKTIKKQIKPATCLPGNKFSPFLHKLKIHIALAYRYILPQEINKKRLLGELQ